MEFTRYSQFSFECTHPWLMEWSNPEKLIFNFFLKQDREMEDDKEDQCCELKVSEGSHPTLLFLLWTGWKRERERGRPWATDWTDFLHGVMTGTGSAAPGSGNKSGHKATASRGARVRRLMTYQKSKEPLEIYGWAEICVSSLSITCRVLVTGVQVIWGF